MFISKLKVCLVFVLITFSSSAWCKSEFSVLFVNPSVQGEPFWQKVQGITEAAAQQFNVKLDVIYGEGNRHIQMAELKKYLDYRATPDYVILMNYPGAAEATLSMLNKYGIKFITLEQTITGAEKEEVGNPQQHYKNWLGEIYHKNESAGYLLAQALRESLNLPAHKIKALAINGHYGSESESRSNGALKYFHEVGIELNQTVYASWSKEQSFDKTEKLLKRYPETNLIWSASDLMAMGALTAARQGRNNQLAIGGFDWLADAVALIESEQLSASVGGHFMMGGWAMVTLFDYHKGHPFWKEHTSLEFELSVITKKNLKFYNWIQNSPDWSLIDFKALLLMNQNQSKYEFSPKVLKKSP